MPWSVGSHSRFLNNKMKFKNKGFRNIGLAIVGRINGKPESSSPSLNKNVSIQTIMVALGVESNWFTLL